MRASPSASLVHRKSLGKGKVAHDDDLEPEGGDGRRRVQEDQDRLPLASSSSAVVLIRSLRRLHCDGLQPSCTKCLKSRDKAECIYMPVSFEENAAARARKQAKAAVYPPTSPIKLRRSWDEALAREEATYSRRARSLSSGDSNPSMSAFAPLDASSVHWSSFPTGLTREVNNFHISEGRYSYDTAPTYPSSASTYSTSSTTSPVEPHFPQLPPSSWAPSGFAPHVSASYQSASMVAPVAHPPPLPRPTASGLPLPLYPPPEAQRYQAWDIPTPPSETPSPCISEPDSHPHINYAPAPPHPPIHSRRRRPRLQHSLSLPMPATDAPLPYRTLVDNLDHVYQPPPKYEVPYYPHTTHTSSIALERQESRQSYFQVPQPQQQQPPYPTYDQRYSLQEQHHPPYPQEHRQYQESFAPEVVFSRHRSDEDLLLTPVVSRPLSPDASSSIDGDISRRSSSGGAGTYEDSEQFGFRLQSW